LYIKHKKNNLSIHIFNNYAILLSILLIYSAVPFFFGLKSLNNDYDLMEKYNINFTATKGIFYHIASASKMFTIATIYILLNKTKFNHSKTYKLFWWTTILLGSFLIIMCWTRTAWFIYFITLIFSIFNYSKLKVKIKGIALTILIFFSILYVYETNQAFRWRLTGGSNFRGEQELTFDQLAKARLPYIAVAIENMNDEGFLSSFLGYGEQKGKDYFEDLKKTFNICVLLFLSFYITSHGTPLWGELIYALIFMDIFIKNDQYKKEKMQNKTSNLTLN
jgi:hypothetical protein